MEIVAIDRVVSTIDFIDGFLSLLEKDSPARRPSVEDKCSLISDCFLPLALVDSAARIVARQSNNYTEDLSRTIPTKNLYAPLSLALISMVSGISPSLPVLVTFARVSRRDPPVLPNIH